MSTLIVHNQTETKEIPFEGKARLKELLTANGLMPQTPCGGNGKCGKCFAFLHRDGEELKNSKILTCVAEIEGDTEIYIPKGLVVGKIRVEGIMPEYHLDPRGKGFGIAVDIGTTTVVARLVDMETGEVLHAASSENPQRAIAADVIGRIDASLKGKAELQKNMIRATVDNLIDSLCKEKEIKKEDLGAKVITGNTTMLYLYTGRSPLSLTKVPYTADCLFGFEEEGNYYPPCFGAFVGADIYTDIVATGIVKKGETAMLIDLGTNGELALYNNGKLTCCATACGPAFEGTGIECGGPATDGAIDHFWVENGEIKYSTIGNKAPTHLCGSAIIDAVACLLQTGHITDTGRLDQTYTIADGVYVTAQDIRQIQLAKSAICSGIITLMEVNHLTADDIKTFYVAGGFGAYLKLESADIIGLIPHELMKKAVVIGNSALSGAVVTLLDKNITAELPLSDCECINLAETEQFSDLYMENMIFDTDE